MKLEEALKLFEEITELCYDSENPRIIEVIEDIYPEASKAKSISKLTLLIEELQIIINEEEFTADEEEFIEEIQEKIEMLSE